MGIDSSLMLINGLRVMWHRILYLLCFIKLLVMLIKRAFGHLELSVSMNSSNKLLLLTFSAVALILVAESQRTKLLKDEKKEMQGLLNSINKPAIKSFQVS